MLSPLFNIEESSANWTEGSEKWKEAKAQQNNPFLEPFPSSLAVFSLHLYFTFLRTIRTLGTVYSPCQMATATRDQPFGLPLTS